jgi:hypothetical protein
MKVTRDSVEAHGRIEHGEVVLPRKFRESFKAWKDGTAIVATVKKYRAKHSDQARAYYHAVVVEEFMKPTGYTHDQMHELLKALHLDKADALDGRNGRLLKGEGGVWYVIGGSTRGLNSLEFYSFVERCRMWGAEFLKCPTEDPNPEWKESAA